MVEATFGTGRVEVGAIAGVGRVGPVGCVLGAEAGDGVDEGGGRAGGDDVFFHVGGVWVGLLA